MGSSWNAENFLPYDGGACLEPVEGDRRRCGVTLIPQVRIDVRTMDCRVASGTPARSLRQTGCVREVSDNNHSRCGRLGVALQAQIVVPLNEHLVIDGTMDVVARDAAVSERFVLENAAPGLFPVALHAHVILTGYIHALSLVNVLSMGIVAVGAIHSILPHRVPVLEAEPRLDGQVTLEAGFRILGGIEDVCAARPPPASR